MPYSLYYKEWRTCVRVVISSRFILNIHVGDPDALKLLEVVCKYFPYDDYENGRIQDKSGNTPFHMVMERKRSPNSIKICEILAASNNINPNTPNKRGKKPGGEKKDQLGPRYKIMQEAGLKFHNHNKEGNKEKKSKADAKPEKIVTCGQSESTKRNSYLYQRSASTEYDDILSSITEPEIRSSELWSSNPEYYVNKRIEELRNKPSAYFEPPPSSSAPQASAVLHHQVSKEHSHPDQPVENDHQPVQNKVDCDAEEVDIRNIGNNFKGYSWEVECTNRVKKFFVNPKVSSKEKIAVVKKIQLIADGIPLNNPKICKEIKSDSKAPIKLFETPIGKGARFIFEIAVQFSPRLTVNIEEQENEYFYSEVIRLWDIVRDHDNLSRSIDQVVENIKKSQARGKTAAFQKKLVMRKNIKKQSTANQEKLRQPQYYVCNEDESATEVAHFSPAGSTREDEYNVTTFYSFNSSFIISMLAGGNDARRDFPYKEWPKEHDIISMPQGKASILLLGRSGTGKTTCCLYRLWNQFQNYWLNAIISGPLLQKKPLRNLQGKEKVTTNGAVVETPCKDLEEKKSDTMHLSIPAEEPISQSNVEGFHQIFITKNYVLCGQMKKRFYDLAAGRDIAVNHMPYEETDIPSTFSDVEDLAYPLFLTARQFFILLDNSLNDGGNFFPRDDEGKQKEKIVSDYDHENPDTLLDFEEDDNEEEKEDDDSDIDDDKSSSQPSTGKKKLHERREVTASYFSEKIWSKISKNRKIDPLLVWMEIKSFIKGSVEAVETEDGYLSQEAYQQLGKNMAPNCANMREDAYEIFKLYVNYVKHRCKDKVFDECDLIHNIYSRLNALKDLPWSVHSIYIDEVQDFTQSELSIFIRICRNPNDLFLTGDTAQSIMKGIAFRFSDLRSTFQRVSEQALKGTKAMKVKVPKIHHLTINFRSHTGVLKLAASVIDLMEYYFSSSFDSLPADQGMFPGPIPVIIHSSNGSTSGFDFLSILNSHKRESSTIEFGAHQVIIVQSEEAKKNLPDVLRSVNVLTVFESKGLEFDDVLLYDFFKYSKVTKI